GVGAAEIDRPVAGQEEGRKSDSESRSADRFTDALSGLFDYAIAEVGGPWSVHDPGEFQFDPVGAKVVEEPAALTEEYWDQVDLDLIEDARGESELRRSSPVHQHVLVAGGFLGALGRRGHVRDVGDERVRRVTRYAAGEDEDRHAVMMIAGPGAGEVER